jgi:hypothetical protein
MTLLLSARRSLRAEGRMTLFRPLPGYRNGDRNLYAALLSLGRCNDRRFGALPHSETEQRARSVIKGALPEWCSAARSRSSKLCMPDVLSDCHSWPPGLGGGTDPTSTRNWFRSVG